MDILEKKQHYIVLFDCYENLLTDKQQTYYEEYYFNNLSLAEISEIYGVSRNAVHKQLKEIFNKLEEYENKLNLYENARQIKKLLKNIDEETRQKIEKLI